MATQVDYDYQAESGGGKFLNLKAKGDKVTIRLAAKPITYFVHWLDNKPVICEDKTTCQTCTIISGFTAEEMKKKENSDLRRRQVFIWPVIDRADGQAKVFKAGVGIFIAVGEFARDPKWGGAEKDATLFDVTITRTEASPQNYYSVVPDPTSLNKEISEEEKKAVEKLGTLIDSVVSGSEEVSEEEVVAEKPSTENASSPEGFIEGLEADKAEEETKTS